MAVQSDGKIVLVGGIGSNNSNINDAGVIRLLANGAPDSTFNGTGALHLVGFHGWQAALEDNDKILIAATQLNAQQTATNALVVRVTTSGQLDPTFGPAQNGIVTLAVPGAVNASTNFISYEPGDGIHVLVTGNDTTGTVATEYLLRLDAGSGKACH
ncbi:MAG: delta-60 repeat domain-containing protein [Sinobacteraceae bacterium]|nr:delta-60 repeat domain-containing protein [Nevskiaceae bacterium]